MKKNLIALMMSIVMAVGSMGGAPVLAAETTAEETVEIEQEEETAEPEVSEENEDASFDAIEEDVSEAEPAQVVEEETEEEPVKEIEKSDEIIDSIDTEITSIEENELLEEADSSADVLMEEENQNVEEEEIIEDVISDLMEESKPGLSASYSADYRYWSQAESGYQGVQEVGCWIVAQAKLIYETGIDRSSYFNPDYYAEWEVNNGLLPNLTNNLNQIDGGNAPVYYANQLGKSLEYLGTKSATADQLWANINAGYYTIVKVDNGNHYVFLDNETSKATGQLYVEDSGGGIRKLSYYGTWNVGYVYSVSGARIQLWGIEDNSTWSGTVQFWAKRFDSDSNHYAIFYIDDVPITGHISSDSSGFFSVSVDTLKYFTGEHQLSIYYANTAAGTWDVKKIIIDNSPFRNRIQLWGIEDNSEWNGTAKLWAKRFDDDSNHYAIFYIDDRPLTGHLSADSGGLFSVSVDTTKYSNGEHQLSIQYVNSVSENWDVRPIIINNSQGIPLTGIQLPASKTVEYGKTLSFQVTYMPEDTTDDKTVTWKSSNTSIFTVSKSGVVKPTGIGIAILTAKVGNFTATSTVTVKKGTPKYSKPGTVNATCGQTLSEIELPAGFTWDTPEQDVGSDGTNSFTATFTPGDTAHYNTVGNISVTVNVSHAFADKWTSSTDTHWHECACGTKADEANHTYGRIVLKEPTCTAKGSRQRSCIVCGKKVTETIAAKGHVWNEDYTIDKEATTTEEGSKSIHCSVCGVVKEGSEVKIPKLAVKLGKTSRGDMFNLANNIKVTWKEVPGAKYYKVYRYGVTDTKESRRIPVIVTTGLVGWDKEPGLTNGHAYRYTVVASLTGKGDSSGDSKLFYTKFMYRLKTVVIGSVKNTVPGGVLVTYDKTTSGDSYVLQYCERQDMVGAKTKVVLGANNTSYVIGGLKKGKTYYISIRVRKKVNGIDYYTTFGVPKKITITK